MSDEPDASAMPAASPRRHVGQGVVVFAVGLFGNWIAAKVKIRVPRIAIRPAAGSWGERAYFFGGGQARDGGERCAHRGFQPRGFRVDCWHGDMRLEFGIGDRELRVWRDASARPGRSGGLLDVPDRDFLGGQQLQQDSNLIRKRPIADSPMADASWGTREQLRKMCPRQAEHRGDRAQLVRGHRPS